MPPARPKRMAWPDSIQRRGGWSHAAVLLELGEHHVERSLCFTGTLRLLERGLEQGVTARRAIGYSQAISQLRGEMSESEAMEASSVLTRRYARRQVGWFKRYPSTHWFEYDDPDRVTQSLALALAHG